jgi:hypothetical protein
MGGNHWTIHHFTDVVSFFKCKATYFQISWSWLYNDAASIDIITLPVYYSLNIKLRTCILSWLFNDAVSKETVSLSDDKIINACDALSEMRIGKGNQTQYTEKSQCHFIHYKSHLIWPGIEPGPPRGEDGE